MVDFNYEQRKELKNQGFRPGFLGDLDVHEGVEIAIPRTYPSERNPEGLRILTIVRIEKRMTQDFDRRITWNIIFEDEHGVPEINTFRDDYPCYYREKPADEEIDIGTD